MFYLALKNSEVRNWKTNEYIRTLYFNLQNSHYHQFEINYITVVITLRYVTLTLTLLGIHLNRSFS